MGPTKVLGGAVLLSMLAGSCSWFFPPKLTKDGAIVGSPRHADLEPRISVPTPEATIGEFVVTGARLTAGRLYSATVLEDGRVLFAGGELWTGNTASYFSSAELYEPGARKFRAAGSMQVARSGHTAVLLRDGRVLIFGGSNTVGQPAELFDPSADKFSLTGKPVGGVSDHCAILLNDGRVLIGGYGWKFQIYDPAQGRFRESSHLHLTPTSPTMVLQRDGGVLIGVRGNQGYYRDACVERFDPVTETFRVLPHSDPSCAAMDTAVRPEIAAGDRGTVTVLRDGKMLIAGGLDCSELPQPMRSGLGADVGMAVGAFARLQCPTTARAWIYDPAAKRKIEIEPMHTKRSGHTATLLKDGTVLIVGGNSEPNSPDAEVYIPPGTGHS